MKLKFLLLIFLFLNLTITTLAKEQKTTLKAGVASVDITPPFPANLGGYAARGDTKSIGAHDRILAQALVLETPEKKIVIVSADLVLVYYKIMEGVYEKVSKEIGVNQDNIFICATHTHSGPGAYCPYLRIIMGSFDKKVRDLIINGISEAIIKANEKLKPAKIGIGSAIVKGVSKNRSYYAPSPKYGPDGITDYEAGIIRVDDMQENIIAIVINFGVHPTVLGPDNLLFSADFVHYTREYLRKVLVDNPEILFINGAVGDQGPYEGKYWYIEDKFAQSRAIGYKLAAQVLPVIRKIQTTSNVKIKTKKYEMPLLEVRKVKGYMYAIVINDTVIITVPGELFSLIGQEIKQLAKQKYHFRNAYIFGLCNECIGYILTEEAYNATPVIYERTMCFGPPQLGNRTKEIAEILMKYMSR